jgi:hypothetical protein
MESTTSGCNCAPHAPTQAPNVDRGIARPAPAKIGPS